ncbi:hypothetical protein ILYODFUR_016166 [Ilyodon furcidens]|uniref:Uncharacterized protein n=1 Tax=Ilyodon furcidens TaxID=33524 RepID=A0ABV0UHZ9_9TELE
MSRLKSVHGVLNIKPISSLMKSKYYRESLNWNTERKGVKGGSDSLFQVFTFIDSRDLGKGAQGVKEREFRQKIEGSMSRTCLQDPGKSRRLCISRRQRSELEQVRTCSFLLQRS